VLAGTARAASRPWTTLHRERFGSTLRQAPRSTGAWALRSRRQVGVRQADVRWICEALHGAGFDHPALPAFPEGDYLKFAIGRIEKDGRA
jgi:hypothetical protein